MKLHTLKILNPYYVAIESGEKTFELRKNDRDYQVGDLITFIKTDGTPHKEKIVFRITYILENVVEYGLKDGYCILALKRL